MARGKIIRGLWEKGRQIKFNKTKNKKNCSPEQPAQIWEGFKCLHYSVNVQVDRTGKTRRTTATKRFMALECNTYLKSKTTPKTKLVIQSFLSIHLMFYKMKHFTLLVDTWNKRYFFIIWKKFLAQSSSSMLPPKQKFQRKTKQPVMVHL